MEQFSWKGGVSKKAQTGSCIETFRALFELNGNWDDSSSLCWSDKLEAADSRFNGTSGSVILFLRMSFVHSCAGMHMRVCICWRIREWNPRIHSLECKVCVFRAAQGRGMSPKLSVTTLSGVTGAVCVCYEWQQVMGVSSSRRVRLEAPSISTSHTYACTQKHIARTALRLSPSTPSMGVTCVLIGVCFISARRSERVSLLQSMRFSFFSVQVVFGQPLAGA